MDGWVVLIPFFVFFSSYLHGIGSLGKVEVFLSKEDVEGYHNNSKRQWDWAMETLQKHSFSGREQVLDIGCGDGKITAYIAEKYPQATVLGLDLSQFTIGFAKEHFSQEKFPNLFFEVGNAEKMSFENEFDVVVSFRAIHWIQDQESAFINMAKALKPGGKALLEFRGKHDNALMQVVRELEKDPKWQTYFQNYTDHRQFHDLPYYEELMQRTGFVIEHSESIIKDEVFNTLQDLTCYWKGAAPVFRRIPEEKKEEFLNDLIERLVAINPPDEKGRIHLPMAKIEIIATKALSD